MNPPGSFRSRSAGPTVRSVVVPGFAFLVFALALAASDPVDPGAEDPVDGAVSGERVATIGTGGVTSVYYALGGSIGRLVNRGQEESGFRCSVETTAGSTANVEALKAGELDFGVARSDVQYGAFLGRGDFEESGPYTRLRSVFSIHPESLVIVARKDSGIETLDDLKGRRVDLGPIGSARRAFLGRLLERMGWTADDFAAAEELRADRRVEALADGEVDAVVFLAAHPDVVVREATDAVESVLVPVEGEEVDALVEEYPYYSYAEIPGGIYEGTAEPVPTFGYRATMVTTADEEDRVVRGIVEAVFGNFETFRRLHPAFADLDRAEMATEALAAPLHPAAREYYVEKGLLE
jgi:hypothetical protein